MKLNLLLLLIFCCSLNSNVCTENEKNVEINKNLQRELEPPKPSKNDFLEKLEPKRIANTYLAQINYCIKEKNSKRFIRWNQYVDNNELTIYLLYLETCSYCPTSDWYSFQIEDLNGNDLKMKNKQTNQYISLIIIIGIFVISHCSYPYNDNLVARRPIKYLTIESTNDKLVAIVLWVEIFI